MNSVATTDFISDIRTGMTYLNVITEFISDNRTGTTVLISEMNSVATFG
jgi:hypothetical protein